jgi:hypothetical protein
MSRPATRRLMIDVLEARTTPATGTFVEDFTSDSSPLSGGFDTPRDGVQISRQAVGHRFVPTPGGPGAPGGRRSLELDAGRRPGAYYLGWTYHTSERGGLAPWEQVTAASIRVRGGGTVVFTGNDEVTFTNTAPADQWVTFAATKDTMGDNGLPLGEVTQFRVATGGQMLVDDVTVTVAAGPPTGEGSEVRVARFGDGMGVYGSPRNDLVRVEFLYDAAGTVRVVGLAGTRVTAITPDATQMTDTVVEVPGFAHAQTYDSYGRPERPERDLFVKLHGGDDQLEVGGRDFSGSRPETSIDDLFISTGRGDSLVVLDRVWLWEALSVTGGPGADDLGIVGRTVLPGIDIRTGAGDDRIQIGRPGARVFDGAEPEDILIRGQDIPDSGGGVRQYSDGIHTGPGNDTVLAAGALSGFFLNLGAGDDRLRFESAAVSRVWLAPGAGWDEVELVESSVWVWVRQHDADDVFRLHRVASSDSRFLGDSPVGRPTKGVRFELPKSGTTLRHDLYSVDLDPSRAPAFVRDRVLAIMNLLDSPAGNRSTVVFAPFDF